MQRPSFSNRARGRFTPREEHKGERSATPRRRIPPPAAKRRSRLRSRTSRSRGNRPATPAKFRAPRPSRPFLGTSRSFESSGSPRSLRTRWSSVVVLPAVASVSHQAASSAEAVSAKTGRPGPQAEASGATGHRRSPTPHWRRRRAVHSRRPRPPFRQGRPPAGAGERPRDPSVAIHCTRRRTKLLPAQSSLRPGSSFRSRSLFRPRSHALVQIALSASRREIVPQAARAASIAVHPAARAIPPTGRPPVQEAIFSRGRSRPARSAAPGDVPPSGMSVRSAHSRPGPRPSGSARPQGGERGRRPFRPGGQRPGRPGGFSKPGARPGSFGKPGLRQAALQQAIRRSARSRPVIVQSVRVPRALPSVQGSGLLVRQQSRRQQLSGPRKPGGFRKSGAPGKSFGKPRPAGKGRTSTTTSSGKPRRPGGIAAPRPGRRPPAGKRRLQVRWFQAQRSAPGRPASRRLSPAKAQAARRIPRRG